MLRSSSPNYGRFSALLTVVVTIPAVANSLQADERFSIYANSGKYGLNLYRIIFDAFRTTPFYIQRGNFRPIGRAWEWSTHAVIGHFGVAFRIPMNYSLGVARVVIAAMFAFTFVRFFEKLLAKPGPNFVKEPRVSLLLLFISAIVPASLVVSHQSGPLNLFPVLYVGTSAMVLLSVFPFMSMRVLQNGSLKVSEVLKFSFIGFLLASINEIAFIGIPLIGLTLCCRYFLTHASFSLAKFRSTIGVKAFFVTISSFLTIFVPIRVLILLSCQANACYSASSFEISNAFPSTLVRRVFTGFLPSQWVRSFSFGVPFEQLLRVGPLLLFALSLLLIPVASNRGPQTSINMVKADQLKDFFVVGVMLVAVAVIPATLVSTSADVQSNRLPVGVPWRESVLTTPTATAFLLLPLVFLLQTFVKRRPSYFWRIFAITLALVSSLATLSVSQKASTNPEGMLNNRIALALVDFDLSGSGNTHRCSLLTDWAEIYNDKNGPDRPKQLQQSLDLYVSRFYAVTHFCVNQNI